MQSIISKGKVCVFHISTPFTGVVENIENTIDPKIGQRLVQVMTTDGRRLRVPLNSLTPVEDYFIRQPINGVKRT